MKNFGQEVDYAIQHYVNHTLSHRHHVDIGIERGAVEFDPNPNLIPERILARLERLKQEHLKTWEHLATP